MSHYLQAVASLPKSPFFNIILVASVGADVLSLVRQLTEEKELIEEKEPTGEKEPTEELVPRVKVKPSG